MARPSNIDLLPEKVRAELEAVLVANNFSGYESIADYFKDKGHDVSRSGIQRYGKRMEQRLQMIRASTEAAKMLANNVDDEENTLSAAVLSMVQSELFESMMHLQEASEIDPEDHEARIKTLSLAARSISELTRASVHNKKYQTEVQERLQKAADAVDKLTSKGGLSAGVAQAIREQILGVAN